MTFSPFVSFRYNSVPSPSLDHVLYVHSRSYYTFPIIFLMHNLICFFFPGTTLHRGISGSKCLALGLAFTKAFSFPCASTGLHTLFLFFPAQHCIGRSLDPNVQHWDLHSLRPFHFPVLLLDYTHFVFFFRYNTTSGDLWIQMITTGRCIQLGQVFISLGFFWTAHSANLVFLEHNNASGDLWIQMTTCGTGIHLGFSISVRYFWTAHSPDFNE